MKLFASFYLFFFKLSIQDIKKTVIEILKIPISTSKLNDKF